MKLNKLNKYLKILFFIVMIVLLSGCNSILLNPKGQIALQQRSLIIIAFLLMLIVVIPTIIMTIIFTWKYRSNKKATYNPNWSHSNKLEVIIWSIPIIIILVLGIITWQSTHQLDPSNQIVDSNNNKPLEIDVIALDWKWMFIYPEQKIITINEMAVPVNIPVQFKITSNSVVNSFFIPSLGSQVYAMAGMQNNLNLIANKPGIYEGISSNFSGPGFSGMKFKVIVTEDNVTFQNWVQKGQYSPKLLNTTQEYEKIAAPSKNNPVEYFSTNNPNLFFQVIKKYAMGAKNEKNNNTK